MNALLRSMALRGPAAAFLRSRDPARFIWSPFRKTRPQAAAEDQEEEGGADSFGSEREHESYSYQPPTKDEAFARGFLKFTKRYQPPSDLEQRLAKIVADLKPDHQNASTEDWQSFSLSDIKVKFWVLSELATSLKHVVPNPLLCDMQTMRDVLEFYSQPVKNITSYAELARNPDARPANVHVIEDPEVFDPRDTTNPRHKGVTAFPKFSPFYFSLRQRQLNPAYRAKTEWHEFEDKSYVYSDPPKNAPWIDRNATDMDRIQYRHPARELE